MDIYYTDKEYAKIGQKRHLRNLVIAQILIDKVFAKGGHFNVYPSKLDDGECVIHAEDDLIGIDHDALGITNPVGAAAKLFVLMANTFDIVDILDYLDDRFAEFMSALSRGDHKHFIRSQIWRRFGVDRSKSSYRRRHSF